ncbi:bacteriorhodopsin [Halovenus rubra]|uniref:Bacteriorhodopsin n=2 Tax=Halovenus rubra TaxID=869890 RepID=A0ACC7E3W2_9EURY|nr:bacteriorhodopsin [Halovenus rubra]
MTEQLLIGQSRLYLFTAGMFLLGAVLFALLALRQPSGPRRFLLISTIPPAAMAITYILMAQDVATVEVTAAGRQQSVMRFVGYTVVLSALGLVFNRLVSPSRRLFAVLFAVFVFTPWAALASWLVSGAAESLMNGLVFVGYLTGCYLLFGPTERSAKTVSDGRRLLFAKLRNLFVICWAALIIQSVVSEQSLGLTNFFVGQITVGYTDAVLAFGIFGLVYAGKNALTDDSSTESRQNKQTDNSIKEPTELRTQD